MLFPLTTVTLLFCLLLNFSIESKEINDVVNIHMDFSLGFFPVNRTIAEDALRERVGRDDRCGPEVDLTIPDGSLQYRDIVGPNQYVISAMVVNFSSPQLEEELCYVDNEYATSHYAVIFRLPGLINNRGPPNEVTLQLAYLTNSRRKVIYPFFHGNVQYIDDITVNGGQVIMSHGDDVMIMNIQRDHECRQQDKLAEDAARDIRHHSMSSFPAEIDWQFCENVNWTPILCQRLLVDKCELTRSHGDFCVNFGEIESKDCDSRMTITEASGMFKEMVFLESMISLNPVRGISSKGIRQLSVQYPCLIN